MKISPLLLSLLIFFAFAQCNSSEKSSDNDSSSEETFQSPPEPEPAPAPGSVVVKGKIVSIDSTSDKSASLTIKLSEIEAYGAGTPQVNSSRPVRVAVANSKVGSYKKLMEANAPIKAVLFSGQQQTLEGTEKSIFSWRLESIEKID